MAPLHMLCSTIKSSVSDTITFERLTCSHASYILLSTSSELKVWLVQL